MSDSACGTPLLIRDGDEPVSLSRISLSAQAEGEKYNEAFVQKLAFEHPEALPIAEIDPASQKNVIRHVSGEVWDDSRREEMKAFFADTLNRFVNVFRPRLETIASEMKQ